MKPSNLHILGIGAALGELVPVPPSAETFNPSLRATGQRSISIASGISGPELAIRAARGALATTAMTVPGPLPVPDLHLHAAMWRGSQGIDFWSRAAFVRDRLGLPAGSGLGIEINGMSNSMIGGLEIATRVLSGSPDLCTAMLTGGETFGAPALDHLHADSGICYGDGGSAALLGRKPGVARLVAINSWSDPSLEGLHRGNARMTPPGSTEVGAQRIAERKRTFTRLTGRSSVARRSKLGITEVVTQSLAEAELSVDQLAWVSLPHYGHALLRSQCLAPLLLPADKTLHGVGSQWGHLGPNDQLAGLTHLLAQKAVDSGDFVMLVGIGIGMTWTAAILEIEHVPTAMARYAPPLIAPWRGQIPSTSPSAKPTRPSPIAPCGHTGRLIKQPGDRSTRSLGSSRRPP